MLIKLVIDRFEGEKAVLLAGEEEKSVVWPKNLLPAGLNEGDILRCSLEPDCEATLAARREAAALLKQLTGE